MERSSSRAVTALLVAIISIPLSSQAIFRSQDDDGKQFEALGDIRDQVYEYQSGQRQMLRRAYSQAIEAYREKLASGIADAVKPDINDPTTFAEFLTEGRQIAKVVTPETEKVHAAATAKGVMLGTEDLSGRQRMLLRNYTRAGSCPASMERILPGFHTLCKSVVGRDAEDELPVGIENDLKALRHRNLEPKSMKLRIKMIEQARDRSNRRPDTQGPMRPTPYRGE
ncbi:MAG: hypothetical protein Greene041662_971 [Candidatus Peregrinibacteria bacterium Greene0416_62]|nr:MAG: hypothetical protein Greene041662_971 [Candidatus Peregrinibacteria bacterium Greene0416_62]TSD00115.1 MAG: hypothetical protein Greene101449_328 [Candidatus Peregrinibacteria bacterium Greene1014_49]